MNEQVNGRNRIGALLDGGGTLMLDMDGTLLDLAYDNYMWLEHIPAEYARRNELSHDDARSHLYAHFRRLEGKLSWYCLDHWSELLDLDIAALHRDENHRIGFLPGAKAFLEFVKTLDCRVLLVSNSHRTTLTIKEEVTDITRYFDEIYLSHDLGAAKEDQPFWEALQRAEPFDPRHTVFVDDNVSVLQSARRYGIGRPLHITRPDTRKPTQPHQEFTGLEGVAELLD